MSQALSAFFYLHGCRYAEASRDGHGFGELHTAFNWLSMAECGTNASMHVADAGWQTHGRLRMEQLVFNAPVKIYMGSDVFGRIGEEAQKAGSRAVVVTSGNIIDSGLYRRLEDVLRSRDISAILFDGIGPDTASDAVNHITSIASAGKAQMIIGLGGVKTLSMARAAALLSPSALKVENFLDGQKPQADALPVFNVPASCRDPFMFRDHLMLTDARNRDCILKSTYGRYPRAVFIDPGSAASIPAATFSFSIMETLMYAIEGYLAERNNFLSECLFLKAISAVAGADRILDDDTEDREAHQKAARAGLVTAMGLSMAGPGLGAALSMVLSSRFRIPRVLAAAMMLPLSLEYSLKLNPEKVARLSPILGGLPAETSVVKTAEQVIEIIRHRIGLKRVRMRLSEFGITADSLSLIADSVRKLDFMSQSSAPIPTEDIIRMLKRTL